jgi:hypothetical protein
MQSFDVIAAGSIPHDSPSFQEISLPVMDGVSTDPVVSKSGASGPSSVNRLVRRTRIGLLALSACRPVYEFTVVQDNNSTILARVSHLLGTEGFERVSEFSSDPRTYDCRVIDEVGAYSKQTHARWKNRWFSVTHLICDGHLRFDVNSTDTDSLSDNYETKLVNLLRHEFESEIAAGQVIVKTRHYVALGP